MVMYVIYGWEDEYGWEVPTMMGKVWMGDILFYNGHVSDICIMQVMCMQL